MIHEQLHESINGMCGFVHSAVIAIAVSLACGHVFGASILLEDFNAERFVDSDFLHTGAGEVPYGVYGSFHQAGNGSNAASTNAVQDGITGTLQIIGTSNESGGWYHDDGGTTPYPDLTGTIGLQISLRLLSGNWGGNIVVTLGNNPLATGGELVWEIPTATLNTATFTTVSLPYASPTTTNGGPIDLTSVDQLNIRGNFSSVDALLFEVDFVQAVSVPEPATGVLVVCGLIAATMSRRRRARRR